MGIYILEQKFKGCRTKEPGNLGDPAGICEQADTGFSYSVDMRNMEINHGRLAMSGVVTEFLTEYWTGVGPREQLEHIAPAFIPAIVAFVCVVQQTPEYSEDEMKNIKASMIGLQRPSTVKAIGA